MRSTYLGLLLLFPALAILNAIYFGSELQSFVRATPRLDSTRDVERFKEVVGRQMYAALVQIFLLAAPTILFFIGLVRGSLGVGDLIFIIVPAAVVILVAIVYKQVEAQARTLPTSDDEIRRQRDAIVHTWLKRPLPDW